MKRILLIALISGLCLAQVRIPGPGGSVISGGGGGGLSVVASGSYAGSFSTTVQPGSPLNVSAGDRICVICEFPASCGANTFSVADTATPVNNGTAVGALNSQTFLCSQMFIVPVVTANSNDYPICTKTGLNEFMGISVIAVRGATAVDQGPASNGAIGSGTPASASFTTTTANEVLVAGLTDFYNITATAGSGYTLGPSSQLSTANGSVAMEYKIVSSIQTGVTSDFTESGGSYYANVGVITVK